MRSADGGFTGVPDSISTSSPKGSTRSRQSWMNYFGRFYRLKLYPLLKRINAYLVRWARSKYRRLVSFKRVRKWWFGVVDRQPEWFTQWQWTTTFEWIR